MTVVNHISLGVLGLMILLQVYAYRDEIVTYLTRRVHRDRPLPPHASIQDRADAAAHATAS
jgi:hypothetical protein